MPYLQTSSETVPDLDTANNIAVTQGDTYTVTADGTFFTEQVRIGDFLISLPLIKSIKENKKDAKIYVVTSPKNIEYVKSNLYIDQVFELKKRGEKL